MAKTEKTSKRVGSIASKLLREKKTPKKVKSVAASALTQRPDKKRNNYHGIQYNLVRVTNYMWKPIEIGE